MKLAKLAALVALAAVPCLQAQARPVSCSLEIARQEVFRGDACNFDASGQDDGSFQLWSPDGAYFVYVNVEAPGRAMGYWNGWEQESHAHDDLGELTRETDDPACWSNGYARLCAR